MTDLPISPESGLLENTHVVFFPNNIVGVEYNFFGPRARRFAQYLRLKAPTECAHLQFEPLLQHDVATKLQKLRSITAFHLKIRASYAQTVSEANEELGKAFSAAASVGSAEVIDLILKPKRRSGGVMSDKLLQIAQFLSKRSDLRDGALKFSIDGMTGVDGDTDEVDVLSDYLIARKKVLRANGSSRALDTTSVFEAIRESYNELHDDLERAAGVQAWQP